MNHPNTHRKPILLYCSRQTQTQEDSDYGLSDSELSDSELSDSEFSDFPPCRKFKENNHNPPLMASCFSAAAPSHSHYFQAATSGSKSQRQLTTSSESQSQPNRRGLGQKNVVNTLLPVHTKVNLYFLTSS